MENYQNINMIIRPDFYITPAVTSSFIHDKYGSIRGELFLTWDNKEVHIKGYPEEFWSIANIIEQYGYEVTIESPYKINKCEIRTRRNVTEKQYLLSETNHVSMLARIRNILG
jgi:hypothetical protein